MDEQEQQQQNQQESFLKQQGNKAKDKLKDEMKKKAKNGMMKFFAKLPIQAKLVIIAIIAAIVLLIFLASAFYTVDKDKEKQANDAAKTAISVSYSGDTSTTRTDENGNTVNTVVVKPNSNNNGYEIAYNSDSQNIENAKEKIEEQTLIPAENFTEFEIAVIGALIDNGANLQYYTEEELKCFPLFIKANAATQNLDLRKNDEKFGGKEHISENYVPQKISDLAENEVPGTILVQRTNTNGTTTILEYMEEEQFNNLMQDAENKGNAVNYFTVNDKGNIVFAEWEHVLITVDDKDDYPENLDESEKVMPTKEGGETTVVPEELEYSQYISKYKIPFEVLIQLLVITEEPEFCKELVDYVIDSKIVINIQEEEVVTTTDETKVYTVHNKEEKSVNYQVNAAQQQIVVGESKFNNAKDDNSEQNNCTSYSSDEVTVKVHTVYTTHSYDFEIIEADTWIAYYKRKYDYENQDPIKEPAEGVLPTPEVIEDNDNEYVKIESEQEQLITDATTINNDEDVKTFIEDTEENYEAQIVLPQDITIKDGRDHVGNYKIISLKDVGGTLQKVYVSGSDKDPRTVYREVEDDQGNGTGNYNLPKQIVVAMKSVDSTDTTKEIPQLNYIYNVNSDETGYELQTVINPLVECKVSALSINNFEKIDTTTTITTTMTKYPADPDPVTTTEIYAIDENGNYQKFLAAYHNSKGAQGQINSIDSWLFGMMEENQNTIELADALKYLLYIYDGQDRGITDLEEIKSIFRPNEMRRATSANSLNQFIRYLHSWEGGGTIYKDSNGVDCYKVQSDGSENGLAVGYGVDIATHGAELRLLGYDTSIGSLIPVEVVDEIERKEIQTMIEQVRSRTAELNLTEYQIYALVSRAYNCGVSGALSSKRGSSNLNFVESYKQYWNADTDNKYGEDASSTDFNHILYTQYMSQPVTSDGEYLSGLENRRKSEWCLFQTGYFGYDLTYGSGHGIDEYYSSSATDFTNGINLYNEDGSVNPDSIQQLEDWLTNDLLNTKIHTKTYEMQGGPFEKWWDYENNVFTSAGYKFQCTWYAYGRANQFLELYGTTHKKWPGSTGNASTWYNSSDNGGQRYFACGSEPRANSLVVWKNGNAAGHVAYVEAVDTVNNRVYISHAGGGRSWFGITDYSIDEMKTLWGYRLLGYVYLDSPK